MTIPFQIVKILANIIFRFFFWVRYEGLAHFPKDGRVILCSNHISVLDPVFLLLPKRNRKIRFMAKSELFKNRLFGALLKWGGAFPVERDTADTASLRTAIEIIEKGEPLGIFPQGGCVRDPIPFRAKSGAAVLAGKTRAAVLPVAIVCKNNRVRPFRPIRICFAPPLTYEELGFSDGSLREARQASRLIAQKVNEMLGVQE